LNPKRPAHWNAQTVERRGTAIATVANRAHLDPRELVQ